MITRTATVTVHHAGQKWDLTGQYTPGLAATQIDPPENPTFECDMALMNGHNVTRLLQEYEDLAIALEDLALEQLT